MAENNFPASILPEHVLNEAARLPCPPRALWHELPPLGSGIPARIRSARPIPPRSSVTEFLSLNPPSFHIGRGELRQFIWSAPDRKHTFLESAGPVAVQVETEFPSLAGPVLSTPQMPGGAALGPFTAPDHTIPSVASCQFSSSAQPVLPLAGSRPALAVDAAPAQKAWQLTNTFFTPCRQLAQPEPGMRPLPVPEAGARPLGAMRVRPTQMAGIIDHRPWLLVDLPQSIIPNCSNAMQEPGHQLSVPLPASALRPRSVFQDTVPGWRDISNSYVRRIEIAFLTEAAASITISSPLPALAR